VTDGPSASPREGNASKDTHPSTSTASTELTQWHRAMWGALGALLPLAIRLAGEQHFYEQMASLQVHGVINIAVPALISVITGAIVAAAFEDERNIKKLLVLGVSAPALIASWNGYSLAGSTAGQNRDLKQLWSESARPNESVPHKNPSGTSHLFQLVPSVYAAEETVATFSHATLSGLEKLRGAISGVVPSRDYFVIAGSYPSLSEAQQEKSVVRGQLHGVAIETFGSPDGYAPPLYSTVISPNLTFEDASALLKTVSEAGFRSAYIWTFGIPLRPAKPPILNLRSIYVKHDGAPGSKKWRFDVLLNGTATESIPQHEFRKEDREVLVNSGSDLVWTPVNLTAVDRAEIRIDIRGYRPNSIKPSAGGFQTTLGVDSPKFVEVPVQNEIALLGSFVFRFEIQ
jgi:hypothetical protein